MSTSSGARSADDLRRALARLRENLDETSLRRLEQRDGMRMGRGDVRTAIVALLSETPMHGYQIIRQIEQRSGGVWRPSPGSVYPTLQMLADEGAIAFEEAGGRKTYALTAAGRAAAVDRPAPWLGPASDDDTRPRDVAVAALSDAGLHLAHAVRELGRTGRPEQIEQAAGVIDEA